MRRPFARNDVLEQLSVPAPALGQSSGWGAGPLYLRDGSIEKLAEDLSLRSNHGSTSKREAAKAAPASNASIANASRPARRARTARRCRSPSAAALARASISS